MRGRTRKRSVDPLHPGGQMGGINTIGSTEKIWYKDMEGIQAYLQMGGGAVSGSGHMHIVPVPNVNGMGYCLCTIQNKRGIVSERWCCQLGTHRSRLSSPGVLLLREDHVDGLLYSHLDGDFAILRLPVWVDRAFAVL
jgi:hypothetical protein